MNYAIANDRELTEMRQEAIGDVADAQRELARIELEMDRRKLGK